MKVFNKIILLAVHEFIPENSLKCLNLNCLEFQFHRKYANLHALVSLELKPTKQRFNKENALQKQSPCISNTPLKLQKINIRELNKV